MDIVYVVKKNLDNVELRFSLRSLENIKYDRVFIVGHKPSWLQNVIHIPFDDNLGKYDNVRNKNRFIMSNKDISQNFIYMNDDFYFLEPQEVEYYEMGSLKNQIEYLKQKGYSSKYVGVIEQLNNIFEDGKSFETHTPFIFNRKKVLELYEKFPEIKGLRSYYGNYYGIETKELISENYIGSDLIKDCKCYDGRKLKIKEGQKLLSSDDGLGEYIKDFMLELFPNQSKFELYNLNQLTMKAKANYNITINGIEYRRGYTYEIDPEINVKNAFGFKDYFDIIEKKEEIKVDKLEEVEDEKIDDLHINKKYLLDCLKQNGIKASHLSKVETLIKKCEENNINY